MPDVPDDPDEDDVAGHIKTWDVDALMRMPPSGVESAPAKPREVPVEPAAPRRRWRRPPRSDPQPAR